MPFCFYHLLVNYTRACTNASLPMLDSERRQYQYLSISHVLLSPSSISASIFCSTFFIAT